MSSERKKARHSKGRLLRAASLLDAAQMQNLVSSYRHQLSDALESSETATQAHHLAKKVLLCLRCCLDCAKSTPHLDWVADAFNSAYPDLLETLGGDRNWRIGLRLLPITALPSSFVSAEQDLITSMAEEMEIMRDGEELHVHRSAAGWLGFLSRVVGAITGSAGSAERGIDTTSRDDGKTAASRFELIASRLHRTLSPGGASSAAPAPGGLWGITGLQATLNDPSQRSIGVELVADVHRILCAGETQSDDTSDSSA